jgi:hypothetical protein
VLRHFPEHAAEVTDPRTREMTLRHLITMASGHDRDMLAEVLALDPTDPVRGFLLIPPDEEPGTVFAYNQPCTYTLAAVIQRNAGMTLTDYLRPRLLDPLGIGEVGWHELPPGRELGFTGLHARTEDVAKLGELYLRHGRWEGRQLLPESWAAEATRKHVDNAGLQPGKPDWEQGYGYQFWMARHGYRGDGAFGQFCVVLPEHDAVLVTTGGTEDMQAVLDAVWTHLLPGFDRAPADEDAAQRLSARLSSLRLDPSGGEHDPTDPDSWVGVRSTATVGDGSPTTLTAVEVDRSPQGWVLTLVEPDDSVTVRFTPGEWAPSTPSTSRDGLALPVAASGGWHGEVLRVEVLFLESAHRMDLQVSPGMASAAWRTRPLDDPPLRRLRCPA